MAERVDPTSSVTIRELTGLRRSVVLVGGALPFQGGASLGGAQRVETTWYPGNARQATQQVLGPIESSPTWRGFWKTNQLANTPAIFREAPGSGSGGPSGSIDAGSSDVQVTSAFALHLLLEDIFRGGQTLAVEWVENQPRLLPSAAGSRTKTVIQRKTVREGVAGSWEFNPDRGDDIAWSITWEWQGRGLKQQKVNASSNSITQELDATRIQADSFANTFSLAQLEQLANAPAEFMRSITRSIQRIANRLKQLGQIINKVRSIPEQLKGQTLDLATNTVAISNQFIDEIGRPPSEALTNRTKVSNLTRTLAFYGGGVRQAQLTRREALRLRERVQASKQAQSTILAVHVVRGPTESLATLSSRFYGTPDYAPGIAQANQLPLNQLAVERGTVLVIPIQDVVRGFSLAG